MNGLTPQEERLFALERTINAFKKYDEGRKNYIAEQDRRIEKLEGRVAELEALTEQQHEQIDDLIDAYDNANGLIDNAESKAYVKKLLDKMSVLKAASRLVGSGAANDKMTLLGEIASLRRSLATAQTRISCLRNENKALKKQMQYDED